MAFLYGPTPISQTFVSGLFIFAAITGAANVIPIPDPCGVSSNAHVSVPSISQSHGGYHPFELKPMVITESQKLNKLAHFAHIISESSTSMDPDIADIVHKHLWEII